MQQWSFGVQREITPSMAFEVRYVGNHSTGVPDRGDSQPNMTPALLSEFQQAATNLSVCSANRTTCTGSATGALRFDNRGLPGQGSIPADRINFPTSFYSSTTFTNQFNAGQLAPGQFWYLVSNNCTLAAIPPRHGLQGLGGRPTRRIPSPHSTRRSPTE